MNKIIVMVLCLVVITATVLPVAGLLPKEAGVFHQFMQNDLQPADGSGLKDVWPMVRYNEGNSGCSSDDSPSTNHVVWKQQIGAEAYQSTPILYGDNLYVSSNPYYDQPPKTGSIFDPPVLSPSEILGGLLEQKNDATSGLYCLNAQTAALVWFRAMNAPNNPAVVADKIYVTDMSSSTYDSDLYCLDAATGDVQWMKTIGGWSLSSTIVANGNIFVGCFDLNTYVGSVQCFDLTGNLLWVHYLSADESLWLSAPAYSGGFVYCITSNIYDYYGGNVYCLNAATGQYVWSHPVFTLGFYIYGTQSPVCFDSNVYVADFNMGTYEGYLKCYSGATGALVWENYLGAVISCSTPAVCDDGVYVTGTDIYSYNSWLYKINPGNGSSVWDAPLPVSSYLSFGSSVCSADKVIVSPGPFYGYSTDIFCFDKKDGSQLWRFVLDAYALGGPSIGKGRLYITDVNGNLYAFEDVLKMPMVSGGLFGVNALLRNVGNATLSNITWSISVMGGSVGFVNRTRTGVIPEVGSGRYKMVRLISVLGMGSVEITVTATLPDASFLKKVRQGYVLGSVVVVFPLK
jgi:eukaryotic-like serine/threonine-protein kinase